MIKFELEATKSDIAISTPGLLLTLRKSFKPDAVCERFDTCNISNFHTYRKYIYSFAYIAVSSGYER